MTPEELALVGITVAALDAERERFSASFDDRLLASAPRTPGLCPGAREGQRPTLADGILYLAGAVRDVPTFVARAHELGAGNRRRGIRPDDYPVMAEALLAALADVLGPAWDHPTRLAWQRLYRLIAETMLEGAAAAAIVGPSA